MEDIDTVGTVEDMLQNNAKRRYEEADECSNAFCSDPGTKRYHENKWADGFTVCPECYEILTA